MGSCCSTCRRRVPRGEREPLLPKHKSPDDLPPPQSPFERVADTLAALSAGKLPSQTQVDAALRQLLASDVLRADAGKHAAYGAATGGASSSTAPGHGFQEVLGDARGVLEAVARLGAEKNHDDVFQELAYQLRMVDSPPVQADLAVNASQDAMDAAQRVAHTLPSPDKLRSDTRKFSSASTTILRLLLTSAPTRALVHDLLYYVRAALADNAAAVGRSALIASGFAEKVERVAKKVERAAEDVEDVAEDVARLAEDAEGKVRAAGTGPEDLPAKAARVQDVMDEEAQRAAEVGTHAVSQGQAIGTAVFEDVVDLKNDLGRTGKGVERETRERWDRVKDEGTERVREIVIQRVQEMMLEAQRNPEYINALKTVLDLSAEYASKITAVSSVVADVQPSVPESGSKDKPSNPFADPPTTSSHLPPSAPHTPLLDEPALPVSVTPVLWTDPHLDAALSALKLLLERLASGRPLDPLLGLLRKVALALAKAPEHLAAKHHLFKHRLHLHHSRSRSKSSSSSSSDSDADPPQPDEAEMSRRELEEEDALLFDAHAWFVDASKYVRTALADAQYAPSRQGAHTVGQLYDRAMDILARVRAAETPFAREAKALLEELDAFAGAIAADRVVHGFVQALAQLGSSVAGLSPQAEVGRRARAARRELLWWLVPRIVRMCGAVPMPRVEMRSPALDAVVDAVMIGAGSLGASIVPDKIKLVNWSEVEIDMTGNGSAGGGETRTRVRVEVEGVRVSARDVGYYVSWRGPLGGWIGWEDEGLVSVDVGGRGEVGEGLKAVVELEMESDTPTTGRFAEPANGRYTDDENGAMEEEESLWKVGDVKVDVPGLRLAIDRSKHWIVNKTLLQPLAGPVGRAAVGYVLGSQIRQGLEGLGRTLGGVKREAERKGAEPGVGEYWEALMERFKGGDEEEESEDEEDDIQVSSHTMPTLKGLVYSTTTQLHPDASHPPTPTETVIAVGLGAQVLPGKGGPHDVDVAEARAEGAREAADEVEGAVEDAAESAVHVREDVDRAQARGTVRERVERRRKGWRSHAFDV